MEFYIHHFSSGRTLAGRSAGRGHVQKKLQWLFAIETCLKTQSVTSVTKIAFLDLILEAAKIEAKCKPVKYQQSWAWKKKKDYRKMAAPLIFTDHDSSKHL